METKALRNSDEIYHNICVLANDFGNVGCCCILIEEE